MAFSIARPALDLTKTVTAGTLRDNLAATRELAAQYANEARTAANGMRDGSWAVYRNDTGAVIDAAELHTFNPNDLHLLSPDGSQRVALEGANLDGFNALLHERSPAEGDVDAYLNAESDAFVADATRELIDPKKVKGGGRSGAAYEGERITNFQAQQIALAQRQLRAQLAHDGQSDFTPAVGAEARAAAEATTEAAPENAATEAASTGWSREKKMKAAAVGVGIAGAGAVLKMNSDVTNHEVDKAKAEVKAKDEAEAAGKGAADKAGKTAAAPLPPADISGAAMNALANGPPSLNGAAAGANLASNGVGAGLGMVLGGGAPAEPAGPSLGWDAIPQQ